MSLIYCPSCKKISFNADTTCPKCGHDIQQSSGRKFYQRKIFGLISLILSIAAFTLPKSLGIIPLISGFIFSFFGLFIDKSKWLSGALMLLLIVFGDADVWKAARKSNAESNNIVYTIQQPKSNSKAEEELAFEKFKIEFEQLFNALLDFKNTNEFKQKGFGTGSKYHYWLVKVNELKTGKGSNLLLSKCGIVVGELEMLGLEYVSTKGDETEYTTYTKKLISNGLKGIKSYE